MKSLYRKSCTGRYLKKIGAGFKLIRTAEQFNSGNWVVWVYSGIDISGEYTSEEFEKSIRKYFK